MDAVFKTALYLGAVLLLGAGIFRRFVGPELALQMRRTLRFGTVFGALLLIVSSLGDVMWRVTELVGRFDAGFILEYTLATRHGQATLVRLALTAFVLTLGFNAPERPSQKGNAHFFLAGVGILGSFSFLSHAAALHGPPALVVDLMHFAGATLWGGAVFYMSLSPAWRRDPADELLVKTMARISGLGLFCVLLLTATGIYASLLHLEQPAQLVSTTYGLALTAKLALVSIILGIAALNRWWFLPALQQGNPQGSPRRFGQVLRLEAALLIAVFAATGLLTTRAPPHTLTSSSDSAKVVTMPNMVRLSSLILPLLSFAVAQTPLPPCGYEDRPASLTSYDDWPYTVLDTLYALPEDYAPNDLEPVTSLGVGTDATQLRSFVMPDLEALLKAAEADGMGLEVQSAYRSYSYQEQTFAYWTEQDGYDAALKSSARPGHSEHQLGTALDFRSADGDPAWELDDWSETPEGAWLQEHAAEFGFVMSYPKGKETLTCYIYEPWHYRYVGREEAAEVAASGLTLREWLWKRKD